MKKLLILVFLLNLSCSDIVDPIIGSVGCSLFDENSAYTLSLTGGESCENIQLVQGCTQIRTENNNIAFITPEFESENNNQLSTSGFVFSKNPLNTGNIVPGQFDLSTFTTTSPTFFLSIAKVTGSLSDTNDLANDAFTIGNLDGTASYTSGTVSINNYDAAENKVDLTLTDVVFQKQSDQTQQCTLNGQISNF